MGIETAMLIASVAGAGLSYIQGQQQASQQKKAMQEAKVANEKTLAAADQEMNRKNAKQPNTAALAAANAQAAQQGNAGTSLTGPTGVDSSQLLLGKNTLLGL